MMEAKNVSSLLRRFLWDKAAKQNAFNYIVDDIKIFIVLLERSGPCN